MSRIPRLKHTATTQSQVTQRMPVLSVKSETRPPSPRHIFTCESLSEDDRSFLSASSSIDTSFNWDVSDDFMSSSDEETAPTKRAHTQQLFEEQVNATASLDSSAPEQPNASLSGQSVNPIKNHENLMAAMLKTRADFIDECLAKESTNRDLISHLMVKCARIDNLEMELMRLEEKLNAMQNTLESAEREVGERNRVIGDLQRNALKM